MDRIENRPTPQIPCPLVQPLLILVPTPTKNPPMIRVGIFIVIEKGISLFEKKEYKDGWDLVDVIQYEDKK